MRDIFNGFECMADIDILNKIKHETIVLNENMDFLRKSFPFTLNFINFFLKYLRFMFDILFLPIALTTRDNRFHHLKS